MELPNFGIFVPVEKDSMSQNLNSKLLKELNAHHDIRLIVNENFLNQAGEVKISDRCDQIASYDPAKGSPVFNCSLLGMQSVAKVCDTDSPTIDIIYNEIIG